MPHPSLARLAAISNAFADGKPLVAKVGRVAAITPDFFKVSGLQADAMIGAEISVRASGGNRKGCVVRVDKEDIVVSPYKGTSGLKIGDIALYAGHFAAQPGASWLGRVINPLGEPIDGKGALKLENGADSARLTTRPPAMLRGRVDRPLRTGVRAIDIFTPLCYGQRLGVFAGSGVGKSTLLGMLAKADAFDCVVVALIGERGREVREFLEDSIGASALAKCIAIVATSDESALMRKTAPLVAMRAAEYFRDRGQRVLLLMDSITRFAHALREIGSSAGEPPVARGYPASVFAELPKLLECAGPGQSDAGSITAIVTVLVDGDDHNDPVADAARGILDGHIVLDRSIANEGRYPPINLLSSLSRVAPRVWTVEQRKLVHQLKNLVSRFEDTKDLRMLGSWRHGEDELLDTAVATVPKIYSAMTQSPDAPTSADPFADLLAHIRQNQGTGSND